MSGGATGPTEAGKQKADIRQPGWSDGWDTGTIRTWRQPISDEELNMRERLGRRQWWLVAAVVASLAFTTGCDPTLKATVEDGIISLSTSFFSAFLQALLQLGEEAQTADTTTTTDTRTTAALLLNYGAQGIFA